MIKEDQNGNQIKSAPIKMIQHHKADVVMPKGRYI